RNCNEGLLLRSQVLCRSLQSPSSGAGQSSEGLMITTNASKYLPQMGPDPLRVLGCAAEKCQNAFALANGFAVEVTIAEPSIGFFCSARCYLNEIPLYCCPRA